MLELFKMRHQFCLACQAGEKVADHLKGAFGRLATRPKGERPKHPLQRDLAVEDFTIEGLFAAHRSNDRLILRAEELASFTRLCP